VATLTATSLLSDVTELSQVEKFSLLPPEVKQQTINKMSDEELESFLYGWEFWGRPEQQLPVHDDWDILFFMAGRGGGKTRPGAEAVHKAAENKEWHIALVGETAAEVRDVMVEGPSGLKATSKPWNPVDYYPSHRRLYWPRTKTWATTSSGDKPDQLRGPNSNFAWVDEVAKFKYPELTWEQLELILRAGSHPQCIVSSTPRPIPLIKMLIKEPRTVIRRWSTYRNLANLAPTYIDRLLGKYEGTRIGRQELHAEILEDTEGALWKLSRIDALRVPYTPHMSIIAVGVDPATSTGGETGIVVMGLSGEDIYCMGDYSMQGLPEEWGAAVVKAYHDFEADIVIAEKNQGGDMVSSIIRAIDPLVPIETVWASRGKRTRAEPISTYTERGKVHHIGSFPDLEDQLTTWVPDEKGMESPDRLDAYVWAATHLLQYTPYGAQSKRAFAA
jgi:phage terminase large subunit-like protein